MPDYTIERLDWAVMLSGAAIGGALFGVSSSWEILPILIGGVIGFFSYAVLVAISKLSGFTRKPETSFRRKAQAIIFLLVWGIVCYALLDLAWSREWFGFAVLVWLALPFAVLCHPTFIRIFFFRPADDKAGYTEHGLRDFTNGTSSHYAPLAFFLSVACRWFCACSTLPSCFGSC